MKGEDMAELEKCPFCGGKAEWGTVLKTWIVCESCGFETPYSQDTEETIRMWNNRTANKEIRAKAIDEFAEKLNTDVESFVAEVDGVRADLLTLDYFSEFVFEIAEELKRVQE